MRIEEKSFKGVCVTTKGFYMSMSESTYTCVQRASLANTLRNYVLQISEGKQMERVDRFHCLTSILPFFP